MYLSFTQMIQSVEYANDHKSKKKIRISFRSEKKDAPIWETEDLQLVFEEFEALRTVLEILASFRSAKTTAALFRYENVQALYTSILISLQNYDQGLICKAVVRFAPRFHNLKPEN